MIDLLKSLAPFLLRRSLASLGLSDPQPSKHLQGVCAMKAAMTKDLLSAQN
jgi:hypothetical protein